MTQTFFTATLAPLIYNALKRDLVVYLQQKGVPKSSLSCFYCGVIMKECVKNNCCDGYVFKCANKNCSKYKTTRTVRSESFLEEFNIDKFVHFVHEFSIETPPKTIIEIVGIFAFIM
jgi:hypothetical protein